MKRFGRYILNALTVLSILLCLATAATWIYALRRPASIDYRWHHGQRGLDLRLGEDIFLHVARQTKLVVDKHAVLRHVELPGLWYDHELLANASAGSVDWHVANVQYWLACAVFGFLPVARGGIAFVRRLRRRPLPPWTCASCGYDLRATPDRCPECGAVGFGPALALRPGLNCDC